MTEKRTEIGELGEFGLIKRIKDGVSNINTTTHLGIGDDAAVINAGDDYTLVSTDMLVEGVHFDLSYMPLAHLGYKAVAVNVSDIVAMNGEAEQITVSLALSNRFSVEAIDALYEGINAAAAKYGVDIVGGDTTASPSGLVISITAIGRVQKDKIAYRSGGQLGEIVCVSGDIAGAYIGLQLLEREKQVYLANPDMQPDLEDYDYMVKRQLRPEARHDIIKELAALDIQPTSMIDISDGLASELFHICEQSNVGVKIFEEKLPIAKVTYNTAVDQFNLDPVTCALNGGEDYELLFTIKETDAAKLAGHHDITMIGYLMAATSGKTLVTKSGSNIPLQAQGWKHF
jgi:thiamine-monophosphate kinase